MNYKLLLVVQGSRLLVFKISRRQLSDRINIAQLVVGLAAVAGVEKRVSVVECLGLDLGNELGANAAAPAARSRAGRPRECALRLLALLWIDLVSRAEAACSLIQVDADDRLLWRGCRLDRRLYRAQPQAGDVLARHGGLSRRRYASVYDLDAGSVSARRLLLFAALLGSGLRLARRGAAAGLHDFLQIGVLKVLRWLLIIKYGLHAESHDTVLFANHVLQLLLARQIEMSAVR